MCNRETEAQTGPELEHGHLASQHQGAQDQAPVTAQPQSLITGVSSRREAAGRAEGEGWCQELVKS